MHVLLVFQRINVEKRYVYPQTEHSVRKQAWRVYSAQELLSYSQSYENIKHSTKVAAEQELLCTVH